LGKLAISALYLRTRQSTVSTLSELVMEVEATVRLIIIPLRSSTIVVI
jgi:hypothetical protein